MWISIVGPTAVGKSSFALEVAEDLIKAGLFQHISLISADSRQVYRGLEIVSGADIPLGFTEVIDDMGIHYERDDGVISLWGIGIIPPDAEWSVAHFQDFARNIVGRIKGNELAIIVGGTGLYHTQLIQADPNLHVPPNPDVRERAENSSLLELQNWLRSIDESKFEKLNDSDQQNPRRLVRAIEIALAQETKPPASMLIQNPIAPPAGIIGLNDSFEEIEARISQRVQQRLDSGAVQEVERLLAEYPNQRLPLFSSTGVKPIMAFLQGQIDSDSLFSSWLVQERQYAKRQLTWYQKESNIQWVSLQTVNWKQMAIDLITTIVETQK